MVQSDYYASNREVAEMFTKGLLERCNDLYLSPMIWKLACPTYAAPPYMTNASARPTCWSAPPSDRSDAPRPFWASGPRRAVWADCYHFVAYQPLMERVTDE